MKLLFVYILGKKISEEENVSFICNIPLIEKLDQSINTLEKCKGH